MKYLFLILVVVAAACATKSAVTDDDEWTAMEEFHAVMADVYHPVKESNDLKPIKSGAGKLAAAASKWAAADLPAKVNDRDTKALLKKLAAETQDLEKTIASSTDEQITAKITLIHDLFHSARERWYMADHKANDKEEHDH